MIVLDTCTLIFDALAPDKLKGASDDMVSLDQRERAQSEIRAMTLECARIGGINLAQGICDTEVPLPVRAGAKEAIDAGINSYTRYDGLKEIRYAIAQKMLEYNGIKADPESEIIVSQLV